MNAKFARALKNGVVIHSTSLNEKTDRGLACNCTCVECGKAVQFVTRRIPFTTKFFRHNERSSCGGGIMTALHRAAQQILVKNNFFDIEQGQVSYDDARLEQQIGDFRADVYAILSDGKPLVCEIVVNCNLTDSKVAYLKEQKIKSIQFDLKNVSHGISDQDLEDLIIKDVKVKSPVYWDMMDPEELEKVEALPTEGPKVGNNAGVWVILGIAILAGWAWLSRKPLVKQNLTKRPKKWLYKQKK